MKNISILGCGWLGMPLAKALIKKEFSVKGSTTTESKLHFLAENNIEAHLISLEKDEINGDLTRFLKDSTILIIDIPPKLRSTNSENFVSKIENIIPFIEQSDVEKVLFVSSTSVYGDTQEIITITEETIPNPDTEGGKQLLQVEKLLQNNINFKTTIVRFGGLIGENRHPIKFLAGRENLENPEAPVNFIHQEDCIGVILQIIKTNSWNEVFNAATPFHPTRKEYYTQKAIEFNLSIPHFEKNKTSIGKIISSFKILTYLNYTFLKKI